MRVAFALVLLAAFAGATAWMSSETRRNRLVWDHWDVVKPGILYRSGQLNGDQLEEAIQRHGLRTVVNFQVAGPAVDAERALCKRLGVEFLNLPMPGDGLGQEVQFREVLAATDNPERRPVLVHCARGTCRTGSAVALYRYERDGWTVEDVAAEMRRQTYRQEIIPGYVYAWVKDRPFAELFDPPIIRDAPETTGPKDLATSQAPVPEPVEKPLPTSLP